MPYVGGPLLLGTLAVGCGGAPTQDPGSTRKAGTTSEALFSNQTAAAFAWVEANGTILSNYSYTDEGYAVTATNQSTGVYTVTICDAVVSGDGGNVQVVAYGTDNDRCTVISWFASGTNVVALRSPKYDAYLWADQPSTSSYYPASGYS